MQWLEWLATDFIVIRAGHKVAEHIALTTPMPAIHSDEGRRSASWLKDVLELQDQLKMNLTVLDLDADVDHWR